MDIDFNAISTGVEFSQLSDAEKLLLHECLLRLVPFGWSNDVMRTWYINRKLSVVREGDTVRYYGLTPTNQWRLLLVDEKGVHTWHVGNFQWLPVLDETAHRNALEAAHRNALKGRFG